MSDCASHSTDKCANFNPDLLFRNLKVIYFLDSFVGLSQSLDIDVGIDLTYSAFIKTRLGGNLVTFEEAQKTSARHKVFEIEIIQNHIIRVKYKPTADCFFREKKKKHFHNLFICDIRIYDITRQQCCSNETHLETARYYLVGKTEHFNSTIQPKVANFGSLAINTTGNAEISIRNDSEFITAKLNYSRAVGFKVIPSEFILPPNCTQDIKIKCKPNSMNISNLILFEVRNLNDMLTHHSTTGNVSKKSKDFLHCYVKVQVNVVYNKIPKKIVIESLHKLNEPNMEYYLTKEELLDRRRFKQFAIMYFRSKDPTTKKVPTTITNIPYINKIETCHVEVVVDTGNKYNFCVQMRETVKNFDILKIVISPDVIDFGRICLNTEGEREIFVFNNTDLHINAIFLKNKYLRYTNKMLKHYQVEIASKVNYKILIYCQCTTKGNFSGDMLYSIDGKFMRKHSYFVNVDDPILEIDEKVLKFGIASANSFVASVPVPIHNRFNVPLTFSWECNYHNLPFNMFTKTGIVKPRTSKICDVFYDSKYTKLKCHEVYFVTGENGEKLPVELNIQSKRVSIKFNEKNVALGYIPLNLETKKIVRLENASKELAFFCIMEPIMPGVEIEPMNGTIRPKMVLDFVLRVKISCVMEFVTELHFKINNRDVIVLSISGTVLETKIIMSPKLISLSRIPCNLYTYIPVVVHNASNVKALIEIVDTGDENIFEVFILKGQAKEKFKDFYLEGGQSETVNIKVYDIFRRQYDMFLPFRINGLIGPPIVNNYATLEYRYYVNEFESLYATNQKVKVVPVHKEITYCRIMGIITVPWIEISEKSFDIEYVDDETTVKFQMKNLSQHKIPVTINTLSLMPQFQLTLDSVQRPVPLTSQEKLFDEVDIIDYEKESHNQLVKFPMVPGSIANFTITFHPGAYGSYVATAPFYLDKHMDLAYHNLTFRGFRSLPIMTSSISRLIYPPSVPGVELIQKFTIRLEAISEMMYFSYKSRDLRNINIHFLELAVDKNASILTVEIVICSETKHSAGTTVTFCNDIGVSCNLYVHYCFTNCPLTLHASSFKNIINTYPFYPVNDETDDLYKYMERTLQFLEIWMFKQGFRKELYPIIPDTFHAISTSYTSQAKGQKNKTNLFNFLRRIDDDFVKNLKRRRNVEYPEPFQSVKEIYDIYKEIILLLKSRGKNIWTLQAEFLLSYDQLVIYVENVKLNEKFKSSLAHEVIADPELYKRLNKQCWMDLILQIYDGFVVESCFFECTCVSKTERDIVAILIEWYNKNISSQHNELRNKNKPVKVIKNITEDLSDGIAIISSFYNYVPYIKFHFKSFCETDDLYDEGAIINNACLIISAFKLFQFNFPLDSKDLLRPNYIQMLFLSIHLFVILPTLQPRDKLVFTAALMESSSRIVSISPWAPVSMSFTPTIMFNKKNCFSVESIPKDDVKNKAKINVKYAANFVTTEKAVLIAQGTAKNTMYDTFIVFLLVGKMGSLTHYKKLRLGAPLYHPTIVSVPLSSPFPYAAKYKIQVVNEEPSIPVKFRDPSVKRFYFRRINAIDKEIHLEAGSMVKNARDSNCVKACFRMICLSTKPLTSWVWFRSKVGEFFIRLLLVPKMDATLDVITLYGDIGMNICECDVECDCDRSNEIIIPHANKFMMNSLRVALHENATESMMDVFDQLIESLPGRIILTMILEENGCVFSEVLTVFAQTVEYKVTGKNVQTGIENVVCSPFTQDLMTIPFSYMIPLDEAQKLNITLTSADGMDSRKYKIVFVEIEKETEEDEP